MVFYNNAAAKPLNTQMPFRRVVKPLKMYSDKTPKCTLTPQHLSNSGRPPASALREAIDCPASARPTTIKLDLSHYLPLQMLTMHLVEVATQACCTTLSEHLSWYFVCVDILCVVYV